MEYTGFEQGSPEWQKVRLGKVTGSRFDDLMHKGRGGAASKTTESYMVELLSEIVTGLPADEIKAKPLEWGKKHEPSARACYSMDHSGRIKQVAFIDHPTQPRCGFSPDGLIGDDGILEIKCPFTSKVHLKTILTNQVPDEYYWQVQGGLWVTGRQWCDFVSFDPRCPDGLNTWVVRAFRENSDIADLSERVQKFVDQLEIKLSRLRRYQNERGR